MEFDVYGPAPYVVYDMNEEDRHTGGKWIVGSLENLAAYIARIEDTHRCIVTDTGDNLILNTIGNYINRCNDKEMLEKLKAILIPLQMKKIAGGELPEVIYV